jgi:hypothetical protein
MAYFELARVGWIRRWSRAALLFCLAGLVGEARAADPVLTIEAAHPWRPPFGLDRVDAARQAVVTFDGATNTDSGRWSIETLQGGRALGAEAVPIPTAAPWIARVDLPALCDRVTLVHTAPTGARRKAGEVGVEAIAVAIEAVARSAPAINPVDLGTVLVPSQTIALGPGSHAVVEVAVRNHNLDDEQFEVSAWYASDPRRESRTITARKGARTDVRIELPPHPLNRDRDAVHVAVEGLGDQPDWSRAFPVMVVSKPPELPRFGATRLKLRYDQPISIRDPKTGAYTSLDYEQGWDAALDDVVVTLPNGARFVFWRGSSYIPFWASRGNTGLCTEWAEEITRRPGAVDCVEPLMDKELRYGRVEVVESSAAHVHVRWTYQSTDLLYQTWGDFAVEDYHFFPDGYGTRVLTLTADPSAIYELSEFIVLTPQGAYPFDALPGHLMDVLLADGSKHGLTFPIDRNAEAALRAQTAWPAIYRVRLNRVDAETAVYFHPGDAQLAPLFFDAFYDRGQLVTPAYWGSHWPLARGNATGSAIDARIAISPAHNSYMSWVKQHPTPFAESRGPTRDALGREHEMVRRRWAWLIGMTAEDDGSVRRVAATYARPPKLHVEGGAAVSDTSAAEFRALGIRDDGPRLTLRNDGDEAWTNPIIELRGGGRSLEAVRLGGALVDPARYAWGGRIVWIDAEVAPGESVELQLGEPVAKPAR